MVPSSENTATQRKRPHTPFWLGALRAGFRAYLDQVHFEQVAGPSGKRVHLWDSEMSDDCDGKPKIAPVVTLSEEPPPLNLPWMPKKPVVTELAAIAGMAQAVGTLDRLSSILGTAQLTHLVLPFLEDELGETRDAVEMALKLWTTWRRSGLSDDPELHVLFCNELADTGARLSSNFKSLAGRVEKHLRAGDTVILVTPRPTLPPALQRHVGQTLNAPRLSQSVLIELLRALHVGAATLPEQELRASLPTDQGLKLITLTQLQAAMRLQDAGQLFARLHQLTSRPQKGAGVTLDSVHGQREAVAHLRRMLADLEAWRYGALPWSEMSMSAVFYGPPGNGKTMLASAFAGTAGIPLHARSYSACQKAGHQGDMLRALHEVFRQAEATAPSVLFIDEIDGFSDRSRESQNEQYMRGVVNGLLTELSRAATVPGLVLLAATNDLSVVDPAVIRPGRFDIRIPVGNPDRAGIQEILANHLGHAKPEGITVADIDWAARELVGLSGADVAARAREALGRARHAGRSVTGDDLRAVCGISVGTDAAARLRRLAVHEAGHLLVRASLDLPAPICVQIGATGGSVISHAISLHTEGTATDVLAELLAGRAAERCLLGSVSSGAGHGPDSDLAKATLLALRMEAEWGFSDRAPMWLPSTIMLSLGIPAALKPAVERRLRSAEAIAERIIEANRQAALALAEILIECRELTGEELTRALDDVGLGRREGGDEARSVAS